MPARIDIDKQQIAAFCRRHHVRKLSLFGSVLTDRFNADSDVDVLVEFEPGKTPGFFTIGRMVNELEAIMGRRVDVLTPNGVSRYFRKDVLKQAEAVYDAA